MRLFAFYRVKGECGWMRLGSLGPGLSWTKSPPLFSERIGKRKPFMRAFGYRWFRLQAWEAGA